jgi:hypothetical protein
VASHSVGHSAEAAESRGETVLLQSVTLTFRTGEDVGSRDAESLQNGAKRVAMRWGVDSLSQIESQNRHTHPGASQTTAEFCDDAVMRDGLTNA